MVIQSDLPGDREPRKGSLAPKEEKMKLSREQREILVGILLGDAHLETQNRGRTYRLKVEHSLKEKE